ncbi:TetR/AcrR family transcriptional regulator [Chitinophaga sp. S165]|uniref:TetR/AcrR family transcriptional regulator n=1 Tax=Chitinophaga sp. S165 TaxID=2135462 RepID=UPI000D70950F|nr:TetR/AcrR family transcriptional regulator [Chitinophaga sp. S165]PWV56594.1 TetR family transcriptional regulator [Chitinophaga sp. S165]
MPKEVLFDEETVLKKATALFLNKGYNGTSMDDLTKATGLSRSSLYNSFGDKHSLFMRCLTYYQAGEHGALSDAVSNIASPVKRIKAAFRYLVDVILKSGTGNGCLIVNTTAELATVDKEVCEFVFRNTDIIEHLFTQWVKEAQQQGEISKTFTPTAIARHLFNTYVGLRISEQSNPDKKFLDDIVKVALSVLV